MIRRLLIALRCWMGVHTIPSAYRLATKEEIATRDDLWYWPCAHPRCTTRCVCMPGVKLEAAFERWRKLGS